MPFSTVSQVLPYARFAQAYVGASFGLDDSTAGDVVQDVLVRLFRRGPEQLEKPKRYFLRACRWRALQILRSRRAQEKAYAEVKKRLEERELQACEPLVALEEKDKPKFFGDLTPKQQEVVGLMRDGRSQVEISAILEIPESTVRMRFQLARKRLSGGAA